MTDRYVIVPVLFMLGFVLFGCVNLSRDYPGIRHYTLDPSADATPGDAPSSTEPLGKPMGESLVVIPFTISPAHEETGFLLRRQGSRVERDFYNRFVIAPVKLIESETASWIQASGLFGEVRTNLDGGRDDWQLSGHVARMEGDFSGVTPVAVLIIQYHVRPGPGRDASRFFRTYSQEYPIASFTPSALSDGWNRAFAMILADLEADLAGHLASQ